MFRAASPAPKPPVVGTPTSSVMTHVLNTPGRGSVPRSSPGANLSSSSESANNARSRSYHNSTESSGRQRQDRSVPAPASGSDSSEFDSIGEDDLDEEDEMLFEGDPAEPVGDRTQQQVLLAQQQQRQGRLRRDAAANKGRNVTVESAWDHTDPEEMLIDGDDAASRLIGDHHGSGLADSCWSSCCCPSTPSSPEDVFRDILKMTTERSINMCIAIVFLSNVGFSIIMPSLWPYLQHFPGGSGCYLGLAISTFSLGQTLGSGSLSLWYEGSRHHIKYILMLSLALVFIGDVWYAAATDLWMVIASRFLTGFGAGNQEVIQGFVASITGPQDRPHHIAALSLFASASFIVGPLLGASVSLLPIYNDQDEYIWINAWTVPGLISAFLCLVGLLLCVGITTPRPRKTFTGDLDEDVEDWTETQGPHISWLLTIGLIFAYFFIFTTGSVYETVVVPFTTCSYQWDLLDNSGLFAVAGFFSAMTYCLLLFIDSQPFSELLRRCGCRLSAPVLTHKVELLLLLLALTVLCGGYIIMISGILFPGDCIAHTLPLWRFLVGSAFVTLTFPFSFSALVNLFSRLLVGKSARYISLRTRLLKIGGYLARMIAPLWSGCVFEYRGFDIVFVVTASGVFFALFILLLFSRYMLHVIDHINASI